MFYFFTGKENITDTSVIITGKDVNHIKNVLRMKEGDNICVHCDSDKRTEYLCFIDEFSENEITCAIIGIKDASNELPSKIYLFQGYPKSDKLETIIQKNIELGVYEIIPMFTERCIVKLDESKTAKKINRFNSIAEAAAKQSRRDIIPVVKPPLSFKEALSYAEENCDVRLIPYELAEDMSATKALINSIEPGQSIAVFIGPEGGFTAAEINAALDAGFKPITLGKRILRTETAGMALMSVLMYRLDG